ncbi:MAG: GGDEF domain-containing protein [Armatimonadota bacterium]
MAHTHSTDPEELLAAARERLAAFMHTPGEGFRTIFENLGIGLGVGDVRGRILECNHALAVFLGVSEEEIIGRKNIEFTHPDDRAADWRLFKELMSGKRERYQVEKRYLHKNGDVIWGRMTVSLIRDDDGVPHLALGLVEDITERKQAEERLLSLLRTDELTGLYNRRGFYTLAEQLLKLALRRKQELLLVYVDIDGMKTINDTHGHTAGDFALIETATLLKDTFRESDIIARFGGDEFVVLAPDTHRSHAARIIERLEAKLLERNAVIYQRFPLSLSYGTVYFDHASPRTLQEILVQADHAMYHEKERKRAQRAQTAG